MNELHPTCKVTGWFRDRCNSDLFHFSDARPAEEIEPDVFAVEVHFTEELDGRDVEGVETVFVIPLPKTMKNLTGEVLPLEAK